MDCPAIIRHRVSNTNVTIKTSKFQVSNTVSVTKKTVSNFIHCSNFTMWSIYSRLTKFILYLSRMQFNVQKKRICLTSKKTSLGWNYPKILETWGILLKFAHNHNSKHVKIDTVNLIILFQDSVLTLFVKLE